MRPRRPLGALRYIACVAAVLATVGAWLAYPDAIKAQEYDFRNLSVADGLAQSQVYAICEDRRGNIWFGTRGGGVSRYDGLTFTPVTEEDGLPSGFIRAIAEGAAGEIWFGTDLGVSLYDGRGMRDMTSRLGLSRKAVTAVARDSSGVVWIGTQEEGLVRYENGAVRRFGVKEGLPGYLITSLCVDTRGRLWVGTNRGAAMFDGLRFTAWGASDGLAVAHVSAVTDDGSGTIWFATYGGGVSRFDGTTFTTVDVDAGLSHNTTLSIAADRNGDIWVGTAGGGVSRIGDSGVTVFTEREGLCNNMVAAVMVDAAGNVWFGSSGGGVSRLSGRRFVRFTGRGGGLGNWVYAVRQDRVGTIWFGSSSGGVTRYDGKTYRRFSEIDGLTAAKVKTIFEDRSGRIWFGTVGEGVFIRRGETFARLSRDDGMRARFINAAAEDDEGNVWLATSDHGAVLCRARSDSSDRFVHVTRSNGLPVNRVYDVLPDGPGNLWIATDGGGIARVRYGGAEPPKVVALHDRSTGLAGNTVRTIARDSSGRILFGTGGGGLVVYDGGAFRSVRRRDGISSDNIYSLVVDRAGRIWLGTEKGIDRIVLNSACRVTESKHFGRAEGVTGVEASQNAAALDREGNIWFGTIEGAVRYSPGEEKPNLVPPKTHLTEIRLFFDRIDSTGYADSLTPWYPIPVGLRLPYHRNHLSFEFVGINQRNPEGVRYSWKLEGFDERWSPRSDRHTAVYSNLPPGDYRFLVVSYNEDGIGNPRPASFTFVIDPPFWATWWFMGLAVAAATAGILLFYRARIAALRRKSLAERHEIEVRKNIVELEQKSLRLSMNPHFIFNALNSIQSFIPGNDPSSASRYLSRFARLMRAILENSRQEHVAIESEMEMLRNYLELERLNLGNRLFYDVSAAPDLDPAAISIPSMLVQPFVENAVLHGIRPRPGTGSVTVLFERAGGLILCSVQDDGVGRRAAAARSSGERSGHRSTAIDVARERLEIMNRALGTDAGIIIVDLENESGGAGTRVEIRMPYISD